MSAGLPDEDGFALAQRLISEVRAQKRQRAGQDGGPVADELVVVARVQVVLDGLARRRQRRIEVIGEEPGDGAVGDVLVDLHRGRRGADVVDRRRAVPEARVVPGIAVHVDGTGFHLRLHGRRMDGHGWRGPGPELMREGIRVLAERIPELVRRVGDLPTPQRTADGIPRLASAMSDVELRQVPAPLLIGERVNSQGSRAVKRLLLADDYDGIVAGGRGQSEGGDHALDICVAMTERNDEAEQMASVVRGLEMAVDAPLIIDSTDAAVIRAALEVNPGRAVVNSVNLENGRTRCENVLPLVRDHGACVIALTIDEQGMVNTADRKLAVATRIRDIACDEFGLQPYQILFDALTFTLATGEREYIDSAHQTIDGIRRIRDALPGVLTVLGVSSVSFGLSVASRPVLNSVFLYHCVQAGLDAAIVNPAHITPYAEIGAAQRELAEDLVFNRREDALARYIGHFDGAS